MNRYFGSGKNVGEQMLFQKLFLLVPSPVQDSVYTDSPPLMPPADGTPEGALVMRWPLAKNWYDFRFFAINWGYMK